MRIMRRRAPDFKHVSLEEPENRRSEVEDQGDGKQVSVHLSVCVAGEVLQPRGLPEEQRMERLGDRDAAPGKAG